MNDMRSNDTSGCTLCASPSQGCEIIYDGRVTRTYLQTSASFRGYCVLVLKRHAVELFELTPDERSALIEDITAVAHAVSLTCKPKKINYEILGNVCPHIHVHVIPRYETDPTRGRPAWFALPDQNRLPTEEYMELAARLRDILADAR